MSCSRDTHGPETSGTFVLYVTDNPGKYERVDITSSLPDGDGSFMPAYLPEGIYRVTVEDTLYRRFEKVSIQVTRERTLI